MQKAKATTQVGPGQAGESHTATAVSPHRILGGATDCSSLPSCSTQPATTTHPNTQAAINAPKTSTQAATTAPTHPNKAANAPQPTTTTQSMLPTSLWQQSTVRNSINNPDNAQTKPRQGVAGKDDEPGSSDTLPVDEVRLLHKRGKFPARESRVGDRKRHTRAGSSQRVARSAAEKAEAKAVRDRLLGRGGATQSDERSDTEPRNRPPVRAGETQREKRPYAEPRDQPSVRAGATQRETRPDAVPSDRPLFRAGETQRESRPDATKSARNDNQTRTSDDTLDLPRPRPNRGKWYKPAHAQAQPAIFNLPGTSEPQPGPSGTGPAKRERPDDTASPGTIQGHAKRVRVYSAQGEQRTYALATKDIPAKLAVAICFPPPSRDLTKEEAEQIKTDLEARLMDANPAAPLPAFRGYPRVAEGTVQMWCEDDHALTWLTQNVPQIKLPNTDLTLTVLKQSDVPTRVRASLFVPRYKGDVARLQSVLIRQNTWYDIARWSLYRATTVGGDNHGTYLTLGVPPEEAERVLARERRVSYLLGSIYVRFEPTTQPCDTTDGTGKDNLPTKTQTNDTDIAQLEEVMARAVMEDDVQTLPPSSPGWNEQLLASSPGDAHIDLHRMEEVVESQSDGSISD